MIISLVINYAHKIEHILLVFRKLVGSFTDYNNQEVKFEKLEVEVIMSLSLYYL